MKRAWHPEELIEHWTILPGEWPLIEHKHGATRLGFAVLCKFFQYAGAFPRAPQDVPLTVVDHVAQQVGVPADTWAQYARDGRTIEYHRAQIRHHLGFREATVADSETLVTWLAEQQFPPCPKDPIRPMPEGSPGASFGSQKPCVTLPSVVSANLLHGFGRFILSNERPAPVRWCNASEGYNGHRGKQ